MSRGEEHVNFELDQFSGKRRQPLVLTFGGPAFDDDGLTFDVPEPSQPLQEGRIRARAPRRRKYANTSEPGCALCLGGVRRGAKRD